MLFRWNVKPICKKAKDGLYKNVTEVSGLCHGQLVHKFLYLDLYRHQKCQNCALTLRRY